MNQVDFSNYLFHCSSLPQLMTNARSKTEVLSKTAQSYLDDIWIKEVFGREKVINSPAMEKGTIVESDSLQLYCDVKGKTLFKNNTELSDEFVIGTPDVTRPLIDIKSSWDIWTFHNVTEKDAGSNYFWQLAGYAMLRKVKTATLVYVLVNTPEHIQFDEVSKLSWKMPQEEAEELVRKNHTYDDIPAELRVKEFKFKFTKEQLNEVRDRIMFAREYLAEQSL